MLEPGTWVMVVDQERSNKWDSKYVGKFRVKRRTRNNAYVLENEIGEEVQPKRTIEMLKVIPDEEMTISEKSEKKNMSDKTYVVEKIVGHRQLEDGSFEYEVKWKGYKKTTWEPKECFTKKSTLTGYWRSVKGKSR